MNHDESGLEMINNTGQISAEKESKVVNQIATGENGKTVPILTFCSLEGHYRLFFMIFKARKLGVIMYIH